MTKIIRGQVALEAGERLRELGLRISKLGDYSGDALEQQIKTISTGLSSAIAQMDQIIRSCRGAKNSYASFPAVRQAIADAGDAVYEIKGDVEGTQNGLGFNNDPELWSALSASLVEAGQRLRLVQFVPPEKKESVAS